MRIALRMNRSDIMVSGRARHKGVHSRMVHTGWSSQIDTIILDQLDCPSDWGDLTGIELWGAVGIFLNMIGYFLHS